ncbi:MAG: 2-oxo acid dehydrogenase subunit E2 [Egibacteraceae bacterium]
MATEVTLPQLGESVTEGTITAWLVDVGDTVEADQPLFELSSDKIDTEVPAPTGGVLTEIKVQVDETVDVGTVVAMIGDEGEAAGDGTGVETAEAEAGQAPSHEGAPSEEVTEEERAGAEQREDTASTEERTETAAEGAETEAAETEAPDMGAARPAEGEPESATGPEVSPPQDGGPSGQASAAVSEGQAPAAVSEGNGEGTLSSPLVRRLAAENDVDLSSVRGSGEGGRITREDVEAAISGGPSAKAASRQEAPAAKEAPKQRDDDAPKAAPEPQRRPVTGAGERSRVEDLSRIRQRIAAKMMESMQSSAQLTTVQEADVTQIMRLRAQVKDEFRSREGVSLSPFVFLCRAAVLALRNHPTANAAADWDAGKVTYHDYVNLGIAVDTEKGLLVPNVKGADDLSLAGLARAISEAANKARGKGKLEMQDIEGGTFTVTNTGSRGVLLDTPILNYPEVAILATGAIQKRPVVSQDSAGEAIAIRDMVYLCLTYDHRLLDGADAARFVTEVSQITETHDWAQEIGYGS